MPVANINAGVIGLLCTAAWLGAGGFIEQLAFLARRVSVVVVEPVDRALLEGAAAVIVPLDGLRVAVPAHQLDFVVREAELERARDRRTPKVVRREGAEPRKARPPRDHVLDVPPGQ